MSLPQICTCPTVPNPDCPFHGRDGKGSLAGETGSVPVPRYLLERLVESAKADWATNFGRANYATAREIERDVEQARELLRAQNT